MSVHLPAVYVCLFYSAKGWMMALVCIRQAPYYEAISSALQGSLC